MKHTKLIFNAFLLASLLALTACGGAPAVEKPVAVPETTEVEEEAPGVEPTPTQEPAEIPCTIAFDSDRDGNREIYAMGPDGSNPTNLTNEPADDRDPAWNPQGTQIAFVSNRETEEGPGQFVFVMNADGSGIRQITGNGADLPDWSPDGGWITYSAFNDIFIIPVDGSAEPINLTNSPDTNDFSPIWSPEGSQIAWLSGAANDPNAYLNIMNIDGSNARQLTNTGNVTNIQWTVDGQIFMSWDGSEHGCCNFVMNPDGSGITSAGGKGEIQRFLPFWTLEGERVECLGIDLNGGDSEIYLVGEIYPDAFYNLTNDPGWDVNPDWPTLCGPVDAAQKPAAQQDQQPQVEQPVQANLQKDSQDLVIGFADYKGNTPKRLENFYIACEELGIQCVEGDGYDLIAQGVDAIVANTDQFSVAGLHPVVMEARDKGILVFVLDAESTSDGAYSVTISQGEWAKTGLGWILESMGGQGEFAYFNRHPDLAYAAVIADMLSSYPEVTVVAEFDGKYEGMDDHQRMEADIANMANEHPDLKGIWANENLMNVLWGLKGSQRPISDWPRFLCEPSNSGLSIWMQMQSEDDSFECFALLNPDGIAYDTVYIAYYLLTGEQLKDTALEGLNGATFYVPLPFVNNENLAEWWQQVEGTPANEFEMLDAPMPPEDIHGRWFVD